MMQYSNNIKLNTILFGTGKCLCVSLLIFQFAACVSTPEKATPKVDKLLTKSVKDKPDCTTQNAVLAQTSEQQKQAGIESKLVPITAVDKPVNTPKNIADINSKNIDKQLLIEDCVPKGIIQIAENLNVDPESQQKFEQSVNLLKQEQYQEAIQILIELTAKLNKFTAPYINLGIAYSKLGEWDKAEDNLKKAMKLNATHPVAGNELGMVYRRTGKYAEARKIYEALIEAYPGYWPLRKNLGVLCDIYLQDLDCALEQYNIYIEARPEDEKMKIWIADVKGRLR